MDKERYERQKAFAGEKKPSMLRRCVGHDYMERQMYMVTMVTEGRRPLFGKVTGRDDAPAGTDDAPRMVLDKLGQRVVDCWNQITERHPQIETIALQMMPDHLHGILFVKERLPKPLGKVLLGFKQGCNKAYRELFPGLLPNTAAAPSVAVPSTAPSVAVPSVAVLQQQTKPASSDRAHGLLFARGYNDKLLLRQGQLQSWLDYLRDNPRRLVIKREHPDLFRVQRGLMVGGQQFSAIGNRFLLSRPLRVQVQCSRSLTDEQIAAHTQECLSLARQGAVLVSPCISKGEKAVMRAAFNAGLPLIILQENGFTDLAKPGGKRMEACASGQLLLLAPWAHHNEHLAITRNQCLTLNTLARLICEGK